MHSSVDDPPPAISVKKRSLLKIISTNLYVICNIYEYRIWVKIVQFKTRAIIGKFTSSNYCSDISITDIYIYFNLIM